MNKTDVFRFAVHRQSGTLNDEDVPSVIEVFDPNNPTSLLVQLSSDRLTDTAAENLQATAQTFVDSAEFIDSLSVLDPSLAILDELPANSDVYRSAINDLANQVDSEKLNRWRLQTSDSFAAAIIVSGEKQSQALDRAIRTLSVIEAVQKNGPLQSSDDVINIVNRSLVLPASVFPLPASNAVGRAAQKIYEEAIEAQKRSLEKREELVAKIIENRMAIRELGHIYKLDHIRTSIDQGSPNTIEKKNAKFTLSGLLFGLFSIFFSKRQSLEQPPPTPFQTVHPELISDLSPVTTSVIERLHRDLASLNVVDVVTELEKENMSLANTLYAGGKTGKVAKLGAGFVLPDATFSEKLVADFDSHVPGLCNVTTPEEPTVKNPTVPDGVGQFRSLGVSDLMVVKQTLLRYETGEVAHIENVLATEERSREHRMLSRSELFVTEETEMSEESERDLQTTERFELQIESEKTIESDSSRNAGITVSGSYGPSVEFTASAGFASNSTTFNSDLASTSHAREITDRAVHRIQERVRRERTTRTIAEVEVLNKHGFLNRGDSAINITGVYRWVDKVYEAQVFNYGKRELIEINIPEPAALFRHLKTAVPPEGLTIERPEEPGYCKVFGSEFEPLEPKHIDPDSYLFWTARYNVQGVEPPPAQFVILGLSLSSNDEQESQAQADNSLQVPNGYVAMRGVYTGNISSRVGSTPGMHVIVGRHPMSSGKVIALNGESGTVPIAILAANVVSYIATVEIECEVTEEFMNDWRIKTFNAIMEAYEELKAEYDAQLERATEFDESIAIKGKNPLINRAIERQELKRSAISQLTGHHFDEFDAVRRRVLPHGYPQADLSEATNEGKYIQFVEQAFEWENMQYLFYPYFWARKDQWPILSQLTDKDPLFEAFLTAGSSRVNVPVRPGFESAVNIFLSTGVLPWNNDPDAPTVISDKTFLSIAEEMRSQQGPINIESSGKISIDSGSAAVIGTDTAFTQDHVNREITFGGSVHIIKSVIDDTHLNLTEPYQGKTLKNSPYIIGAKAVGVPWTVKIPTSLVYLQTDSELPTFPEK